MIDIDQLRMHTRGAKFYVSNPVVLEHYRNGAD